MSDLVSVIVPVFNRSSQIQGALDSVLKQTYQHWEIVVVDDGSTDRNTTKLVQEYAREEPRIHLLHHVQRKGAQAARNTGIAASQGKWITFLDSDDELLADSLELRLQVALERKLDVVHSDCYVLKQGKPEPERFGIGPVQGWVYKDLLRRPITTGYLLFSKKAFDRIAPLDETLVSGQDWDISIRLAKYYEFGFVPEPTFIWDCRQSDTISNDLLRTAVGYKQVFTKHRWSILQHLGPKALAFHYQTAAACYREANEKAQAHRCLLIAFLLWPFRAGTIVRRARRFLGRHLMVGHR